MTSTAYSGSKQMRDHKTQIQALLQSAKINLLSAGSQLIMDDNKAAANRLAAVAHKIETIRRELPDCHHNSASSVSAATHTRETSSCPGI